MPDPKSLVEMITPTDVHALRRVSRMFGRMQEEAKKHEGHGDSCPFANADMVEDVFMTREAIDALVAAYEEQAGGTPTFVLPPQSDLMH